MPENEIGEAYVRIRPDSSGFEREAETGISGSFKRLATTAATAFASAGVAAVGGALTKLSQSQERATINLRRAVENTGTSFKAYGKDLDIAERQQAKFGNNSIETTKALTTLTFKLKDPKKALDALSLASDVAAAKNISLEEATSLVTRAYSGNVKVLGQFGINIKDSKAAITDATKAQVAHREAVERVHKAEQDLSDLQAILAAKKKITISDEFRLRDAKQELAEAQAGLTTATQVDVAAQAAAQGAIKGTDEAVGKLRESVKGLADEQASTLEGRLKGVRAELQNFAIEAGQKAGPAIAALGTASTLAANAVAVGLNPALLGTVGAFGAAAAAGAGLGVVLNGLIEEHFPGINRALESLGAKLFDLGPRLIGTKEATGLLADAQRIFGLTGEETTRKVDGQIRALATLAAQAEGSTRGAIQKMIEKLEAIHPEYRTSIIVEAPGITGVINYLNRVADAAQRVAQTNTVRHNAAGGSLGAGDVSWVGERGPELFVSSRDGRVLSHEDSMRAVTAAGGDGGQASPMVPPIIFQTYLDSVKVAEQVYDPLRRMNSGTV